MVGIAGQIIGEFGELGKQVGSEVVKTPKEIAGKALESLGASAKGVKGQMTTSPTKSPETLSGKPTPLDEFAQAKDAKTKQTIARRALEYLAGGGKQPEPSVRDRLEREEAEKKTLEEKKANESEMAPLPVSSSRRKRGDLFGISGKASMEKSRNVRQD